MYGKNCLAALLCVLVALPAAAAGSNDSRNEVFHAAGSGVARLHQLLACGANINAVDDEGKTALMLAAEKGQVGTVNALLAAGADVNATDDDGDTALMHAADEGNNAVVRLLLDAGADINIRNKEGETAFDIANEEGHTEIMELLRSAISPVHRPGN